MEDLVEKFGIKYKISFSYPKGWYGLLNDLLINLISMGWNPQDCIQVKEKFGGLRFYAANITPEMNKYIILAENESELICECCGAILSEVGKQEPPSKSYWIRNICVCCSWDWWKEPMTKTK